MPLDLTRIRALCFDVDGTLCDTDNQWTNRFERALRPLRRAFPQGNARPFARWMVMGLESPGNIVYAALDRVGLDGTVAGIYNFMARRLPTRRPRSFLLVPGVQEMLDALQPHYPLAVVSARDRRTTLAFLEFHDLAVHFPIVVTSQTCRYTKPFPDPILYAAREMGVQPRECLMVGDTTVDIRSGKAAGAQTVGVLCGFGQEAELRKAGADLILPSTADLVDVLSVIAQQPGAS